jgi:hypothetical protein
LPRDFPTKIQYPSCSDKEYSTSSEASSQTIVEVTVQEEELSARNVVDVVLVGVQLGQREGEEAVE